MAKDASFDAFIKRERARLQKARKDAVAKQAEADQQLQSVERELKAIEAYERAKRDKAETAPKRAVRRRSRARKGEKRAAVLDLIKQHPGGLSRGELITVMGVKGDKSGEQSVSNALSALKKINQVSSRDGRYVAG